MGFEELEFEIVYPNAKDRHQNKEKGRLADVKRYVIGCDPYDENPLVKDYYDRGFNAFAIFDKASGSYSYKVVTRKSFDDFVEDCKKIFNENSFTVSHKFITATGRSVLGQIPSPTC